MNIKKRLATKLGYISALVFALFSLSAPLAPVASAQVRTGQLCQGANLTFGGSDPTPCQVDNGSGGKEAAADKANTIVADVINLVSIVVGIIAVFMIIYGGFRFLTSAGNPESTKVGKNAILYAIIGLVIVAFAQVIVKFVLAKITS
jgi:hypothetical protein